jgi:hypothetical protein
MRHIFLFAIVFCLLSPFAYGQDELIPNLKGVWTSSSHFHYKDKGYIKADAKTGKLTITSQEGRVFEGTIEWDHKDSGKDTISGVIEKDNKTLLISGHKEVAFRLGRIESPDSFTLYVLATGGTNSRAGYVEYTRVK